MFALKEQPVCPVFGECGGCLYQDCSYEEELKIKEHQLRVLLKTKLDLEEDCFDPIEPSPKVYHYRHRLDLKLQRTRNSGVLMGFSPNPIPQPRWGMVPIESCAIAHKGISDFIPRLKQEALEKFPSNYRQANLVVRCGDEGKIFWGGIGKKSLTQRNEDYLWTEIRGRKIFYSLETFFQANLSILPKIFEYLNTLPLWSDQVHFYDLYGGVGLFGIGLIDIVKRVTLIEESPASMTLAEYNIFFHQLKNFSLVKGRVEEKLPDLLKNNQGEITVAMIDPPRGGLSPTVCELLSQAKNLDHLLYLSCNPQALARDLTVLTQKSWHVVKIKPFDFFPRTKHLETLVYLRRHS